MADYIYQRNIKAIQNFYDSDKYLDLKEAGEKVLIQNIISKIYVDPDSRDVRLYEELSQELNFRHEKGKCVLFNDAGIKMSADAVCGWKNIYKLHNGGQEWLSDYKGIRMKANAHFVWPQHKVPTINTLRYTVFRDRIDYTLFDIKRFFDCIESQKEINANCKSAIRENCKLQKAYLNPNGTTFDWLIKFKTFRGFVERMKLQKYIYEDYKVRNLSEITESAISDYCASYKFNEIYLENLIKLFKD